MKWVIGPGRLVEGGIVVVRVHQFNISRQDNQLIIPFLQMFLFYVKVVFLMSTSGLAVWWRVAWWLQVGTLEGHQNKISWQGKTHPWADMEIFNQMLLRLGCWSSLCKRFLYLVAASMPKCLEREICFDFWGRMTLEVWYLMMKTLGINQGTTCASEHDSGAVHMG